MMSMYAGEYHILHAEIQRNSKETILEIGTIKSVTYMGHLDTRSLQTYVALGQGAAILVQLKTNVYRQTCLSSPTIPVAFTMNVLQKSDF